VASSAENTSPLGGKTWFAAGLEEGLEGLGVPVCRIEADWYLLSREDRKQKELKLVREVFGHTYVPADLHLSYWRWDALAEAVARAKTLACQGAGGELRLQGLYDRCTGECTLEKALSVKGGDASVIVVEGCYLLARELGADVSILLYVNREITGAMVGRQPFGGNRLSGTGTKAGGPGYLLQFVEPRVVSENTVRHGLVV